MCDHLLCKQVDIGFCLMSNPNCDFCDNEAVGVCVVEAHGIQFIELCCWTHNNGVQFRDLREAWRENANILLDKEISLQLDEKSKKIRLGV